MQMWKSLIVRGGRYGLIGLSLLAGQVYGGVINADWQAEWEKTVEAARKEGRVVLSTVNGLSDWYSEFEKDSPGIKVVEGATGSTSERTQVLLAERRAGKYLKDVSVGQQDPTQIRLFVEKGILDPITPTLILPEVVDSSSWWSGKHHYMDSEKRFFFIFEGTSRAGDIGYNKQLVNSKEIGSYWDLLSPKWKGKIVVADPRDPRMRGSSGHRLILFYHHPDLGAKYIRRLYGEMEVTLSRDYIQMVNWLGAGKFAFNFFSRSLEDAIKQGLPVGQFMATQFKEGGLLGPVRGVIALINRAPQPNAAKVFINWALSKKGQIGFQRVSAAADPSNGNSLREDIPKDVIPPEYRRIKGFKYMEALTEEVLDTRPIIKLVDETLTAVGK
jgi:iron(III) transport system substrate-binding protein